MGKGAKARFMSGWMLNSDIIDRIAVVRKRYNDSVRVFNTKIRRFPASIIATMMGYEKKEYFEIEEAAREVPEVDFES